MAMPLPALVPLPVARHPSPPSPSSPALHSLLEAAGDVACDFAADAGAALRPLVAAALAEQGALSASGSSSSEGELLEVVSSLGWDHDSGAFGKPVDPRSLAARLKAALLSDLRLVGEGSYSFVYRAHNRLDGRTITLKKLRLEGSGGEGLPATAIREISLLRELDGCPFIVSLLDVLYDRSRIYLVLEHLDVDLHDHLTTSPAARTPDSVRSYMWQALRGVEYAHSHRVIHRDLKPQNILVDRATNKIKLADFGLSRTYLPAACGARPFTREVVTLLYRAPEILLGCKHYSTAVDVWSLGCIFAELVGGHPLFAGDSEIGQLYQIFQLLGTPDERMWPGVTSLPDWHPLFPKWRAQDLCQRLPGLCLAGADLLSRLLRFNPDDRPSCKQALQHPYFDGFVPPPNPGASA